MSHESSWPWREETEATGTERKLNELLDVVNAQGLRDDQTKKLLIFTEHKDTLRYLVEKLVPGLRSGARSTAASASLSGSKRSGTSGSGLRSWWPPRRLARASTSSSAT